MSDLLDGLFADSQKEGIGIEMINGDRFLILDPRPDMLDPGVIAHALGNLCRFTGHVNRFYSVAQHCVHVSYLVPREQALTGLLHDASEAFIGDVSRPLKAILQELAPGVLSGIEERIHEVLAETFGGQYPHPPEVKMADNTALATERRDLLSDSGREWLNMPDPDRMKIDPLNPTAASLLWMIRFEQLTSGKSP